MTRAACPIMAAGLGLLATTAPPEGVPVVLGAGMRGDRVSVIFGSLAELEGFIDETC